MRLYQKRTYVFVVLCTLMALCISNLSTAGKKKVVKVEGASLVQQGVTIQVTSAASEEQKEKLAKQYRVTQLVTELLKCCHTIDWHGFNWVPLYSFLIGYLSNHSEYYFLTITRKTTGHEVVQGIVALMTSQTCSALKEQDAILLVLTMLIQHLNDETTGLFDASENEGHENLAVVQALRGKKEQIDAAFTLPVIERVQVCYGEEHARELLQGILSPFFLKSAKLMECKLSNSLIDLERFIAGDLNIFPAENHGGQYSNGANESVSYFLQRYPLDKQWNILVSLIKESFENNEILCDCVRKTLKSEMMVRQKFCEGMIAYWDNCLSSVAAATDDHQKVLKDIAKLAVYAFEFNFLTRPVKASGSAVLMNAMSSGGEDALSLEQEPSLLMQCREALSQYRALRFEKKVDGCRCRHGQIKCIKKYGDPVFISEGYDSGQRPESYAFRRSYVALTRAFSDQAIMEMLMPELMSVELIPSVYIRNLMEHGCSLSQRVSTFLGSYERLMIPCPKMFEALLKIFADVGEKHNLVPLFHLVNQLVGHYQDNITDKVKGFERQLQVNRCSMDYHRCP